MLLQYGSKKSNTGGTRNHAFPEKRLQPHLITSPGHLPSRTPIPVAELLQIVAKSTLKSALGFIYLCSDSFWTRISAVPVLYLYLYLYLYLRPQLSASGTVLFPPAPSPICTATFLAKQHSASPKCFLVCISIKLRFVTDSPKRQYALLGCLQPIFGYNWKNIPFFWRFIKRESCHIFEKRVVIGKEAAHPCSAAAVFAAFSVKTKMCLERHPSPGIFCLALPGCTGRRGVGWR